MSGDCETFFASDRSRIGKDKSMYLEKEFRNHLYSDEEEKMEDRDDNR